MNSESDKLFMGLAMELAHTAYENNEVPVGAVVVQNRNAEILAAFSNQMRSTGSSLAHAEMLALQKSMEVINNERLVGCNMYVSLEPCPMCAGAIIHSRISKIVYGAKDLRWGASGTIVNLFEKNLFNHNVETKYLFNPDCGKILKDFFNSKR